MMMSTQQDHEGEQEAVEKLREGTQGVNIIILCLHQGRRTRKQSVKTGLVLALGTWSVYAQTQGTLPIPAPVLRGRLSSISLQNDLRFSYVLFVTEYLTFSSSSFSLYFKIFLTYKALSYIFLKLQFILICFKLSKLC